MNSLCSRPNLVERKERTETTTERSETTTEKSVTNKEKRTETKKNTETQFNDRLDKLMLGHLLSAGNLVSDACDYHFQQGGSRQRARLCYQTARSFGFRHIDSLNMAACVELIHNASLVHDDIQDKDIIRRNAQSVWVKYSRDVAICIGDAMILAAFQCLSSINTSVTKNPNKKNVLKLVTQRSLETVHGQVKDITNNSKINATQYHQIAVEKSAPLIMLSVEIPALLYGNKDYTESLRSSASYFALAYQFYDDLIDAQLDDNSDEPNIVNITMYKEPKQNWKTAKYQVKKDILRLLCNARDELKSCPKKYSNPLLRRINNLNEVVKGASL
jgi:geranylgeranyl pyrophosphate synthase